ncbi:MAG: YdbL family protein [Pseudomonadota bacterium]
MTHRIGSALLIGLLLTLAACVTINVYFPEAAAERAADRFIQDVLGEGGPGGGDGMSDAPPSAQRFHLLDLFIAPAYAQAPNINIDTPQIESIKQRMAGRQSSQLAGWFDAGAIGFSNDGLVEIRDRSAVSLSERRNLERVVAEENADRNAVYREIAVANGHPEWEGDIRDTFARQWIANARAGWFYQNSAGAWVQK